MGISRFIGLMVIDGTSPDLNGNLPPNWNHLCDEINEILDWTSNLILLCRWILFSMKIILTVLFFLLYLLVGDRVIFGYIPMPVGIVGFVATPFCIALLLTRICILHTYKILSEVLSSHSSNDVRYELKVDPISKQKFILVHRTEDV